MPLGKIVVLTRNFILDPVLIPQIPGGRGGGEGGGGTQMARGVSGSSMDTQKAP